MNDLLQVTGLLVVRRLDAHGEVIEECVTRNLVTAVGDQYYAARAALGSGLPAQVTGMRLGTGSTVPAKTGSGAALVTYLTGSNHALDAGYPTAVAGVVTWKCTWAAGVATTASAITEVVLNTDTIANDNATTATAANTVARALITGITGKAAGEVLDVVWSHTLAGT